MAAMHTTMIRANMTAYSTAVGPSSAFRNDTRLLVKLRHVSISRVEVIRGLFRVALSSPSRHRALQSGPVGTRARLYALKAQIVVHPTRRTSDVGDGGRKGPR